MLAQVVLVQQFGLHGFLAGGDCLRVESHEGQFFQDYCVMYGVMRVRTPGEGPVGMDQDGRDIIAIEIPQAAPCDRPVYIGSDPYTGSYHRNGDGDYRCSREDVDRMLRKAGR